MRLNIAIFAVLIILSGCATTQKQLEPAGPDEQPMKKADAILIPYEGQSKSAYREIAQVMQDKGYTIANSDATLLQLSTEKEQLTGEAHVKFTASVRDDYIKLTGHLEVKSSMAYMDEPIMHYGKDRHYTMKAWNEMQSLAASVNEDALQYTRNK